MMNMDNWVNARQAKPPSHSTGFISRSSLAVNITFINELGIPFRVRADQHTNLAALAEQVGIRMKELPNRDHFELEFSHMIISSPHCECLEPPDIYEDRSIRLLEKYHTVHKNSRFIKYLWVNPSMEGMVVVSPLHADVWTINLANPFTGKVEDKDKAKAPNLAINQVRNLNAPDYKFPSVWECLWKNIYTYPELWDFTRHKFLQRQAFRAAVSSK
jgi:hypothetical protein